MGNLLVQTLAVVGGVTLCYIGYTVVDFIALHFIRPSRPLQRYKRSGETTYALITGASAGIGLGVAQELVLQGFGVVLLAHQAAGLAEAKATLQRLVPDAAVRVLVMDAITATPAEMKEAIDSLKELDVGILVNNVGGNAISPPPVRALSTYTSDDVDVVIDQNARFMARLTAMMIPVFTQRTGCRSLIMSMSSAGLLGLPWLTMYGATKAFNLGFSRGVSRELEALPDTQHIDSLAIIPGDVVSQGNRIGVPPSAPSWDTFGRLVVQTADGAISRRMRDLSPYWLHDIQDRAVPWLSERTLTKEIDKAIIRKKIAWDDYFEKNK